MQHSVGVVTYNSSCNLHHILTDNRYVPQFCFLSQPVQFCSQGSVVNAKIWDTFGEEEANRISSYFYTFCFHIYSVGVTYLPSMSFCHTM